MVNYTFGDGYKRIIDFEIKPSTGDICISGNLDFERRSSYEFPIIATDRGECSIESCPFMGADATLRSTSAQQAMVNGRKM